MPRAITIETSIEIAAAPEAIWPFLVDWEHLDRWMKEAKEFRVLTSHREGVGVEAQATIHIAGIRTTDRIRVTEWEPGRLLVLEHLGWVRGSGRMELRSMGGATLLLWTERLVPPWGVAGAFGMWLLKPQMRRIFRRDLALLRDLVESQR